MPKTFLLYVYNKNGTVRGVIRTLDAFGRADHSNTVTRVTWLMPVVVVGGTARHADTADRDQKGHMLGTVHRDCRQCNRLRSQPPLALSTTIKRPYTPRTVSCSGGRVAAAAAAAAVYIYIQGGPRKPGLFSDLITLRRLVLENKVEKKGTKLAFQ